MTNKYYQKKKTKSSERKHVKPQRKTPKETREKRISKSQ